MSSVLESYWDFFYAREIATRLPAVMLQKCDGCSVNSLSQREHTCLALTKREQLSLYFEDVLQVTDERHILLQWRDAVSSLADVTPEYRALYELKLNDPDWRATMKTQNWTNRMIHMAAQLTHLERLW